MVLLRREAVILASFLKYFTSSWNERKGKIEDATAELSLDDLSIEMGNYYGRKYIEKEFFFQMNTYKHSYPNN